MRRLWVLLVTLLLVSSASTQTQLEVAEGQIVARANKLRQNNGLAPLAPSTILLQAARSHSDEMAKLGYFEHESPVLARRYPWDRVALAGADADSISENLYEGPAELDKLPAAVLGSWEKSPEHRANLLDPLKTTLGVGIALKGKKAYVTAVFSSPLSER